MRGKQIKIWMPAAAPTFCLLVAHTAFSPLASFLYYFDRHDVTANLIYLACAA
jgi:hypothetical protein